MLDVYVQKAPLREKRKRKAPGKNHTKKKNPACYGLLSLYFFFCFSYCSSLLKLLSDREEILGNFDFIKATVFDTADLEKEQAELQNEIEVVAGMIQQAIGENAHFALDQDEYQTRYNGLVDRFNLAKARHTAVTEEITDKQTRLSTMNSFLDTLRRQDNLLAEFDEKLWCSLVDYATVYDKYDVHSLLRTERKFKHNPLVKTLHC